VHTIYKRVYTHKYELIEKTQKYELIEKHTKIWTNWKNTKIWTNWKNTNVWTNWKKTQYNNINCNIAFTKLIDSLPTSSEINLTYIRS